MTLFDLYVAVDWSAAKTPGRGSETIWIALLGRDGSGAVQNPPTRATAAARVRDVLCSGVATGDRALVGFDFAYGFPTGFADAAAPGSGPPWRRVWDELARLVTDSDENVNNRHDVAVDLNGRLGHPAFWGSGDARLPPRRPLARPLPELRVVERELRRGAHPKAVWQLSYAGSVGSQTLLLGIPRVRALRDDPELAWRSAVWPFETDFALPEETRIVHAEIYPTIGEALRPLHAVRDAHQVLSTVELWRDLDRAGELGRLFADPSGIEPSEKAAAAREEGWILGAPLVPDGDWRRARPRVYAAVW